MAEETLFAPALISAQRDNTNLLVTLFETGVNPLADEGQLQLATPDAPSEHDPRALFVIHGAAGFSGPSKFAHAYATPVPAPGAAFVCGICTARLMTRRRRA